MHSHTHSTSLPPWTRARCMTPSWRAILRPQHMASSRTIAVLIVISAVNTTAFYPVAPPCFPSAYLRLLACASSEDGDIVSSGRVYASLEQRRAQLALRRDLIIQERKYIMALADGGPNSDSATRSLRQHWGGEEGTAAGEAIESATNAEHATALVAVMEQYPDWAEPINRLATRRYRDGDVAEAIQLFLRVLRMKPWHFGALHGILMCHVQLGNEEEADRWEAACMPRQADERSEWVARMLRELDAKVSDLELSDPGEN